MGAVISYLLEMGPVGLTVTLAMYFFPTLMLYCFMYKLLPNRLNIVSIFLVSLVYALWYVLNNRTLLGSSYHLWMNIFINALTFSILIFCFKGKFWRRIVISFYFDIVRTICQVVSYVPLLLYRASLGYRGSWAQLVSSVESDLRLKLFYMTAFVAMFALIGFLSLAIWRRILMRKFHPFYLLFIALPMGLRYSLTNVFRPGMGDWFLAILINLNFDLETCYQILSLFGVSLCLVASASIFFYVLSYDKRAALEAQLLEAKRVMELEQARYGEVERRGEELAKIRHDFNNQLASVIQLVRAREDGAAREIIEALTEEINSVEG